MSAVERERAIREAYIIGGAISNVTVPPAEFYFSDTWVIASSNGVKRSACFLLSERSEDASQIDSILRTLRAENFFKSLYRK